MVRIDVVAVGRLKERHWREACDEYARRLTPAARLSIREIQDEPLPVRPGDAGEREAMEREGRAILAAIAPGSLVVALDRLGEKLSSQGLAQLLERWAVQGRSEFAFIIGGAAGLSPDVLARADFRLSFSDLTFPHQMMRVMLLEQLYRAFKIMRHEPYHR